MPNTDRQEVARLKAKVNRVIRTAREEKAELEANNAELKKDLTEATKIAQGAVARLEGGNTDSQTVKHLEALNKQLSQDCITYTNGLSFKRKEVALLRKDLRDTTANFNAAVLRVRELEAHIDVIKRDNIRMRDNRDDASSYKMQVETYKAEVKRLKAKVTRMVRSKRYQAGCAAYDIFKESDNS